MRPRILHVRYWAIKLRLASTSRSYYGTHQYGEVGSWFDIISMYFYSHKPFGFPDSNTNNFMSSAIDEIEPRTLRFLKFHTFINGHTLFSTSQSLLQIPHGPHHVKHIGSFLSVSHFYLFTIGRMPNWTQLETELLHGFP